MKFEQKNQFFPTIPHTYFSIKFRTTFNFIGVFTDDKPDTCATIIQNVMSMFQLQTHTLIDQNTIEVASFPSGVNLIAFIRGFFGLKGLPLKGLFYKTNVIFH